VKRVLTILATVAALAACGGAPRYVGAPTDHFDGEAFHNVPEVREPSFWDLLTWQLDGKEIPWPEDRRYPPPVVPTARSNELIVTQVNHATMLIQIGNVNILTDPVWSEHIGPVSFAGPKRARPPGIRFEDLPHIDLVLISHNHHDHCDAPTLRRLEQVHHPMFVGGLGSRALFASFEIDADRTVEMDWWSQRTFKGLMLGFAPAQHWSARSIGDRNHTLWGGFYLRSATQSVFFAGDSGFGTHFSNIRAHWGAPTVALLPIGAYSPEWFMHAHHMSPDEAVRAHQALGAAQSYGTHWGTFDLSNEGQYEPAAKLRAALRARGIADVKFVALDNGERGTQAGQTK
jgi:L-ascorbate metabolism protein UlaG (beta-lactamase superfamily)